MCCRRTHRAVAACLLSSIGLLSCQGTETETPLAPIIIIDIDTLRADHLGLYGYPRATSPHLDTFAEEAIVFDWAFSQAPNTPPSQTSILTGLYPSTHGMVRDGDRVPDEVVTLAEAVSGAGYETAGFHDGAYMRRTFNIGQGFAVYKNGRRKGLRSIGPKAIRWLREHYQEPFLLLIHTYDVHAPYAPPSPFTHTFTAGLAPPTPGFSPTAERLNEIRHSQFTDSPIELSANDLAYAKALYDGGIRFVDDWFGTFMQVVRELGLDRSAIIVVVSDHGEEFLEHGSVLHEKLYATVTRVPLVIRLPNGAMAQRVNSVVETVDLMPTLLSLVGVEIPDEVQGKSLVPQIDGSATDEPGIAFGESPFFGGRRFVATEEFRLLDTRDYDRTELYRYRDDPLEQRNLALRESEQVEHLLRMLAEWRTMVSTAGIAPDSADAELDPETLEDLKALGYVQ